MPTPFDPRELLSHAVSAARVGLDVYSWTEKQVVDALRHGLDALDGTDATPAPEESDPEAPTPVQTTKPAPDSLGGKLSQRDVVPESRLRGATAVHTAKVRGRHRVPSR